MAPLSTDTVIFQAPEKGDDADKPQRKGRGRIRLDSGRIREDAKKTEDADDGPLLSGYSQRDRPA
jgi:hypothetical protein